MDGSLQPFRSPKNCHQQQFTVCVQESISFTWGLLRSMVISPQKNKNRGRCLHMLKSGSFIKYCKQQHFTLDREEGCITLVPAASLEEHAPKHQDFVLTDWLMRERARGCYHCHAICCTSSSFLPCHPLPWVNRHLKLNQQVLQYTYCPQATWKWTQMWYSNNKNNSQIYRKREESAQAALPVPYPPTQKVSRSDLQRAPSEKQKERCLQRPGSQVWFVCVISVSGDVLAQNTEYTSVWKMLTKPKLFEDLYCHLNCQSAST